MYNVLERTCTAIVYSLNLLFSDPLVAVVGEVCFSSLSSCRHLFLLLTLIQIARANLRFYSVYSVTTRESMLASGELI